MQQQPTLPPKDMRWGGPKYRDDDFYLKSAVNSVRTLERHTDLSEGARVLDIGCGQGRLLTGLIAEYENFHYTGIDVHKPSIDWCQEHLQANFPDHCSFVHIDVVNERYNPRGGIHQQAANLPEGPFDVVSLFSVFSHLRLADISAYLDYLKKVLSPQGKAFFSAFVAYGVEPEEENPKDYHREWSGPLHAVRLNKFVFETEIYERGFVIERFEFRKSADGQSIYVVSLEGDSPFRAKVYN